MSEVGISHYIDDLDASDLRNYKSHPKIHVKKNFEQNLLLSEIADLKSKLENEIAKTLKLTDDVEELNETVFYVLTTRVPIVCTTSKTKSPTYIN